MSRIFDEKFEDSTGDGYDETGWTEVVGTGATIDSDADVADVSSPANWGSECLKIIHKATKATYVYNQIGDADIRYTRIEVVFTDLSSLVSTDNRFFIAAAANNALNALCWYLFIRKSVSIIRFTIGALLDGSTHTWSRSDDVIVEDTLYRIEIEWDSSANNNMEWRINGVMQDQANLTAGHDDMGAVLLGYNSTTDVVDGEFYADLVAIDNADWVGAEGWGGKVLGVSNPAKVMGVEISKIIGV